MKPVILSLVLAAACHAAAPAQEILSLKQCIETGLERNYSIRIIRNEERIAAGNATPGNAGYLPTVDASAGLAGSANNYNNHMPDGTVEKLNGIHSEAIDAGLNMNWTLFDGFGIQADYEKLKELRRMGELSTRMTVEDFIASVAAEYHSLVRQTIRLKNLRYAVSLSKERLRIVEERYAIGSVSRLDMQQAQVDFNADSSLLLTQFEAIHSSRVRLNELMALDDINRRTRIRDSVIDVNTLLDENMLRENMLANNAALLAAERNKTLSDLDYKKALSRNYPYLLLNAGYGYTHSWMGTGTVDLQKRLGLSYGLTVGFNLFDGMNRRREQRNARIQIQNSELRTQALELSLRASHSNLWMAYRNNLELWKLEKENLVVAQENYSIAIERYRLGDLAGIELREAQNSLLEAEERRSIVEYNIKLCEISLLQLSGQIFTCLE
jgi:outer membrane protein TolC